jgi:uncharacterized membrane protein
MDGRSPNAGVGGRTQQAGTLVAATVMPITFQPTLMPRSALDQALVTGISTSLNYAFAALIQDSIEALALRGAGRTDPGAGRPPRLAAGQRGAGCGRRRRRAGHPARPAGAAR